MQLRRMIRAQAPIASAGEFLKLPFVTDDE